MPSDSAASSSARPTVAAPSPASISGTLRPLRPAFSGDHPMVPEPSPADGGCANDRTNRGGTTMSKVSKSSADNHVEFPIGEDRNSDLDGYTVSFVTINETHSMAPMLAS